MSEDLSFLSSRIIVHRQTQDLNQIYSKARLGSCHSTRPLIPRQSESRLHPWWCKCCFPSKESISILFQNHHQECDYVYHQFLCPSTSPSLVLFNSWRVLLTSCFTNSLNTLELIVVENNFSTRNHISGLRLLSLFASFCVRKRADLYHSNSVGRLGSQLPHEIGLPENTSYEAWLGQVSLSTSNFSRESLVRFKQCCGKFRDEDWRESREQSCQNQVRIRLRIHDNTKHGEQLWTSLFARQ